MIKVVNPGLATSVQDQGRIGYYNVGIPPSGALDQFSYRAANFLVGNLPSAAALECTLLGPRLEIQHAVTVAVTGACMTPKVDGNEMPLNTAFQIAAGQILSFDYIKFGARAYIAFAGGIDIPSVMGSFSTYRQGGIGGFCGRLLKAGDEIHINPSNMETKITNRSLPRSLQSDVGGDVTLRVIEGMYSHRLTEASLERFYAEAWPVSSEADRTGYRFKNSQPFEFKPRPQPFGAGSDPSNIVDACYPIGSIQLPGGKEPIILHRDAVSCGGYVTIGTVISSDMDKLAQMQPSQKACFKKITMEEALEHRRHYNRRLVNLERLFTAT